MIFTIQIFAQTKARLVTTILILLTLSFFNTVHAAEANSNPYERRLNDWSATLGRFVDEQGRTDFETLSKDTAQLQRFVDAIAKVSPSSHPALFPTKAHVLAYHINAYNALAMKGVIDRGIPENLSSLWKRASFFRFRSVVIGGKKTNLYDYENKVIRSLGEPRVHFALNCMVVDCPRLPVKVFTAASLDSDLQAAAVEFFNKPKHIVISSNQKAVYLSRIMKFYTKDYVASGDKQDLLAYVNQYRIDAVPSGYRVKFLDYNWAINQAPEPQLSRERDLEFKSKITKIAG
jgi:hypothetical protein